MRKNYLLIAASAVALLTSCSSESDIANERTELEQQVPVQFSTYMGRTTSSRAADTQTDDPMSTDKLQTAGFGVFAYYTQNNNYNSSQTPNFMYNQKVSTANWTYSPIKYWPNDNATADNASATGTSSNSSKISFFAYAPFTGNETTGVVSGDNTYGIVAITPANSGTGDPKIGYKFNTTAGGKNVDILWGTAGANTYNIVSGSTEETKDKDGNTTGTRLNINLTKQQVTEKIKFSFKHALAKIGSIKAICDVTESTDKIKGDALNGTKVFIESISLKATTNTGGELNLFTGAWDCTGTGYSGTQDLTFNYTTSDFVDKVKYDNSWSNYDAITTAGVIHYTNESTAADDILASGKGDGFYLMPTESNQSITVTVKYWTITKDEHLKDGWSKVEQTITNTLTFSKLEMNKVYNLILHFGLTSVKFEATYNDWSTEGESKDINLPINVKAGS